LGSTKVAATKPFGAAVTVDSENSETRRLTGKDFRETTFDKKKLGALDG